VFVANAAAPSFISGGFRGLNGSQVNKISIAATLLTRPPWRICGRWAAVSFVGSRSKARRPEASGLSFSATETFRCATRWQGGYGLGTGIELERSPVERLSEDSVGVNHGELRGSEGGVRRAAFGEFGVKMIHQQRC
jgi:hypothetical protein